METRNLYRDNERAAVAAFHNGKLLYIVTYFFGAEGLLSATTAQ